MFTWKFFVRLVSTADILLDENSDPDKQFYNTSDNFYDIPYFSYNEAIDILQQNQNVNFSIFTLTLYL